MNNLIFWLYIASIADTVKNTFSGLAISIAFAFLLIAVVYLASEFSDIVKSVLYKYIKIMIIPFTLFLLLGLFFPSSKFSYMVIGLKTVEISIENMQGLEEFDKARKILNLKLDDILKDNDKKDK